MIKLRANGTFRSMHHFRFLPLPTACQHLSDSMSIRKPVSPPNSTEVNGSYKCYVDCEGQVWEVFWTGLHNYPDLSSLALHRVVLSNHISTTWHTTKQLDFGSSAVMRTFDHGTFPVVKLAHPPTSKHDSKFNTSTTSCENWLVRRQYQKSILTHSETRTVFTVSD